MDHRRQLLSALATAAGARHGPHPSGRVRRASLSRYIRRTRDKGARIGGLEGVEDAISWEMIRFLLGQAQRNRRKYRAMFRDVTLPKLFLPNRAALERFCRDEHLTTGGPNSRLIG